MLSVQAPGCAGMERLGAPGGQRLRHDHRHHPHALGCGQQLEQVVGRLLEQHAAAEARARSAAAAEMLGLPPSLTLPDGEHGPDAHLQIRAPYMQAELTRSSIQPPPNKSVSDVPEWAGVEAASAPRRTSPGKKDGFVQKAVRYLYRMGARPPPPAILQQLGANELAAQRLQRELRRAPPPPTAASAPAAAPCVMVPLRAPHPPPDA